MSAVEIRLLLALEHIGDRDRPRAQLELLALGMTDARPDLDTVCRL